MTAPVADREFAAELVLDELFDLSLYLELRAWADEPLRGTLDALIPVERRHREIWERVLGRRVERLDWARALKLRLVAGACRLLGRNAAWLALEAIEIYGIRKYLRVWDAYRDTEIGPDLEAVLDEELGHENEVMSGDAGRRINPERVRSVFLGLNDGLVEMLGVVSGFFAAFKSPEPILVASATVAAAGAVSMAAGAYMASSSEREMLALEAGRRRFLEKERSPARDADNPLGPALLVGTSYLAGAAMPVLPVLFGSRSMAASLALAGAALAAVSAIVAFLSGMELRRRAALNLAIMAAAVGVAWSIGRLAAAVWGIDA